jgi:hypothetical protein
VEAIYAKIVSKNPAFIALGTAVSDPCSHSPFAEHTTDKLMSIAHTPIATDRRTVNRYARTTTERKIFHQSRLVNYAKGQHICINDVFIILLTEHAHNAVAKSFRNNCAGDTICVNIEINGYVTPDPLLTTKTQMKPQQPFPKS